MLRLLPEKRSIIYYKKGGIEGYHLTWRIDYSDPRWETVRKKIFQLNLKKQNKLRFSLFELYKRRFVFDASTLYIQYCHNGVKDVFPVDSETGAEIEEIFHRAGIAEQNSRRIKRL